MSRLLQSRKQTVKVRIDVMQLPLLDFAAEKDDTDRDDIITVALAQYFVARALVDEEFAQAVQAAREKITAEFEEKLAKDIGLVHGDIAQEVFGKKTETEPEAPKEPVL